MAELLLGEFQRSNSSLHNFGFPSAMITATVRERIERLKRQRNVTNLLDN